MRCQRFVLSIVAIAATAVLVTGVMASVWPLVWPEGGVSPASPSLEPRTDRPIIGILSQELSPVIQKFYGYHHSYIAASYVKLIESAGARVAPIFIGRPASYYREMVESLNGVLLPGGATYFEGPHGYGAAGISLYQEVLRANARGDYVPLLGICLGMELIAVAAAGGTKRDLRTTFGLNNDYAALSTDKDKNGLTFISSFESKFMPIYGLQFHPEKPSYEWKKNKNYPHKLEAINIGRYFADFLVSEAQKNNHTFIKNKEREHLIYKYAPTDTGSHLAYEQLYFFTRENTSDEKKELVA